MVMVMMLDGDGDSECKIPSPGGKPEYGALSLAL